MGSHNDQRSIVWNIIVLIPLSMHLIHEGMFDKEMLHTPSCVKSIAHHTQKSAHLYTDFSCNTDGIYTGKYAKYTKAVPCDL